MYATVREPRRAGGSDTPICASNSRQTLVYTSHTSSVIVQLSAHAVEDPSTNFLIRFRGTAKLGHSQSRPSVSTSKPGLSESHTRTPLVA